LTVRPLVHEYVTVTVVVAGRQVPGVRFWLVTTLFV
jgi:hypothetical protein